MINGSNDSNNNVNVISDHHKKPRTLNVNIQDNFEKSFSYSSDSSGNNRNMNEFVRTPSSSTSSTHSTSSSLLSHDDNKEILEVDIRTEIIRVRFPSLSLQICIADLLCLAEGELLNGTIIDFYLNHISRHLLQDSNLRIHILPSLFWCNLKLWVRNLNRCSGKMFGNRCENEILNPSTVQYWLNAEDIFDADFIVIPVNEFNHWSLTIILLPSPNVSADLSVCEPTLIIFDSQQSVELPYTDDVANTLKTFLWRASELSSRKENFMKEKVKTVIPKNLPQQVNDTDCGLYVLEYAECFLLHPPIKDLSISGNFDFEMHYPGFNISSKRRSIRSALFTLCVDSNKWSHFFDVEQCDTIIV